MRFNIFNKIALKLDERFRRNDLLFATIEPVGFYTTHLNESRSILEVADINERRPSPVCVTWEKSLIHRVG